VDTILSLDDALLVRSWPTWVMQLLRGLTGHSGRLPAWLGRIVARIPQQREERRQRGDRRLLLEQDERAERRLSFAGRGE
jgi:hypothetical protein